MTIITVIKNNINNNIIYIIININY